MAVKTTQNETTAIAAANRELEQALQELDDQIREYETYARNLAEEMRSYRASRRKWLI